MAPARDPTKGTVVFFSMDALGHIHPILSIVRELKRRSYRALICTIRPLKNAKKFEQMGIELAHCQEGDAIESTSTKGTSVNAKTSEDRMREIMQPLIENFRRGIIDAYESTYKLGGAVDKHLDDAWKNHDTIETKLKSLRPDVIVYDHVLGLPCATTVAPRWVRVYSGFPSSLVSAVDDNYCAGLGLKMSEMGKKWKEFELNAKGPLRERIRDFWREKGGQDWPHELDLSPTSPYLNFYLGPEELGLDRVPNLQRLPDVWFRLEHTLEEDDNQPLREFEMPSKLLSIPGKLVYFSLGTLVTCDTKLINRLLSIFSKSPNRFIVSMGQMHNEIHLYDNMWGQMYVDQKAILEKADLFVTHGGHNSIIEAFYYGVPGLIVLPVFADQFDSAQRIQDCGFGFRLNPFECTEEALLSAVDSVLNNSDLKMRMQQGAMYSHLKSTERHLKLLTTPFGLKKSARSGWNARRLNATGAFSNSSSFKDYSLLSRNFAKVNRSGIHGTIKVQKVDTKSITTAASPSDESPIPLLNPNKPNPDSIKDQILKSIEPITAPRFPKTSVVLPSVTRILQDTMPAASRFLLDRWKEAMIRKLGPAGFNQYQQDTFERGRVLHALVANYLMGQGGPTVISKEIVANLWKSIENVVKQNISNVRLVEHVVTHSDMKYRGIVDCVACYKDELVVIDFKTAEKPKKNVDSLYDNPIQVTAYCGAINNDNNIPLSVIDRNICSGLVIVAYVDGSEASVYYLGREKVLNEYWKKWTTRLDQYTKLEAMKTETMNASR